MNDGTVFIFWVNYPFKSANPIRVTLRTGATMPRKPQYPLKPEAEEGIKRTIEGLMKAGVLVETTIHCNNIVSG